ncbi:tetratricopeptide repeat protein [Candidatus Parabeggiatoa sp. HSG14]|uniref:tetratricopeptide repeat protein n=1 Tax=Candidatus Parabeggiatoa sp. HSG14 TaxID=3055593 RepID=UPI0025A90376|nr:tetratricopeptide repeat protein [Thiotrichales bacterium HSG14]
MNKKVFNDYQLAAEQGNAQAQFELGKAYYKHEEYEQAIDWLREAALQGYIEAQFELGKVHYDREEYKQAINWLHKAAMQGYIEAKFELGKTYYEREKYEQAINWLREVAIQGYIEAQFYLGKVYCKIQNYKRAWKLWLQLANQGYTEAQFELGRERYRNSKNSNHYLKAARWLCKAVNQEHIGAQYYLGEAYFYGRGVTLNYNRALDLYTQADEQIEFAETNETEIDKKSEYDDYIIEEIKNKPKKNNDSEISELVKTLQYKQAVKWSELANKGDIEAKYHLGIAFNNGKGIFEYSARAFELLYEAAEMEYTKAQVDLGILYSKGKIASDGYSNAMYWWHQAASQNNYDALFQIGFAYYRKKNEKGELVQSDIKQAIDWWKKAANKGQREAQYRLGNIYYDGIKDKVGSIIVDSDKEKAVEFWQKAAEQGHLTAQYNLGVVVYRKPGATKDDEKKALEWFKKVAKYPDENAPLVISARYLLGTMYKNARGCVQNLQEARKWLDLVAKKVKKEVGNFPKNENDFLEVVLDENNIQKELITIVQISAQEALEDIAKLEEKEKSRQKLEKANTELENMMGLIAHKFRGSIQALHYNATHENQPSISLESLETMRGLFEIFGIISTSSENLSEKLLLDREGEGTVLATLEKSLSLALTDLLVEDNRNKILQHYIAYAKKNNSVDINVTSKQWRRKQEYLILWKQLQTQWQDTFMLSSKKLDWVQAHLFPLEINTFDNNKIHFEHHSITESILVIAMNEIILNAIKYYSIQENNTTVKLFWKIQPDFCIFLCENPYSENESKRADKGSNKGQSFLTMIADKLGGHFSTLVSQNNYIAEFKIPANLLIMEDI